MIFFNTPARRTEEFKPQADNRVKLYTCGPTVYDHLHVGNWVAYIRWDILARTLSSAGYEVERVMNITDVGHLTSDADEGEDKLEKGARREGQSAWEIADKYTSEFKKGMQDLALLPPTHMPRATEHIAEQISLIQNLEAKSYTYQISDGIYFDTSRFPSYADFAGLVLSGQEAGARIGLNAEKRSPADFALWKFTPQGQRRDMEWDSPWGKGFPGWHLECSAMAIKYLGDTLDIHTGGIDHIPVHHTNEIAQSEAATGKRFSNYWLHNNFLLVDGEKISKSLGNGISLQQLVDKGFDLMDFKLFVLQSHYRTESNFSWDNLKAARSRRLKLQSFADLRFQPKDSPAISSDEFNRALDAVKQALYDDLNTPVALARLYGFTDAQQVLPSANLKDHLDFLKELDGLFGLRLLSSVDVGNDIKEMISQRESARGRSDWQTADDIRNRLIQAGVELNDTDNGPVWNRLK